MCIANINDGKEKKGKGLHLMWRQQWSLMSLIFDCYKTWVITKPVNSQSMVLPRTRKRNLKRKEKKKYIYSSFTEAWRHYVS